MRRVTRWLSLGAVAAASVVGVAACASKTEPPGISGDQLPSTTTTTTTSPTASASPASAGPTSTSSGSGSATSTSSSSGG